MHKEKKWKVIFNFFYSNWKNGITSELDLAYVHSIRFPAGRVDNLALAAHYFKGRVIGNDSFSALEAADFIASGRLAAVSFGRAFIANPDLVDRFWRHKPLGYVSAHIGKWHMRGDPGKEGYVLHDGDTDNNSA